MRTSAYQVGHFCQAPTQNLLGDRVYAMHFAEEMHDWPERKLAHLALYNLPFEMVNWMGEADQSPPGHVKVGNAV